MEKAIQEIEKELEERVRFFKSEDRLLEAQRISERTNFDIEMMRETGFCSGIENYSRHLTGLAAGNRPYTLLDFFPEDFLSSWMSHILPFRRSAGCMPGISQGRVPWWNLVSACLQPRITGR